MLPTAQYSVGIFGRVTLYGKLISIGWNLVSNLVKIL